jgi:hypothetical protein
MQVFSYRCRFTVHFKQAIIPTLANTRNMRELSSPDRIRSCMNNCGAINISRKHKSHPGRIWCHPRTICIPVLPVGYNTLLLQLLMTLYSYYRSFTLDRCRNPLIQCRCCLRLASYLFSSAPKLLWQQISEHVTQPNCQ